jgi:ParB family chromosome partitioning protein
MPVIVRDVDDEQAAAIALIENLQREDLNPLEEALGLVRLIDEFDLTHQEAGRAVGKSRAAVSNLIRLLELCAEAQQLLAEGKLDMGHARALLALSGSRSQAEAAREVIAKGLSVRQTEALVKRLQSGASTHRTKTAPVVDRDIQRLQNDLGDKLGAKVAIQHGAKGKGKLVISYNSNDELEGILEHIK